LDPDVDVVIAAGRLGARTAGASREVLAFDTDLHIIIIVNYGRRPTKPTITAALGSQQRRERMCF
jgi:hypothetical protein